METTVRPITVNKVKDFIRIKHNLLDSEINDNINAAIADLASVDVENPENDPLILNAIKLYCKSCAITDAEESAKWLSRYEDLKASLMTKSGYGL